MSVLETAQAAAKRKKKKKAVRKNCRTVKKRVHGRIVKKRVCTPKKRKKVVVRRPGPSPASPPATTPTGPLPVPPQNPPAAADPMVYSGSFGAAQAERLLWRAGFGPSPGWPEALAAMGVDAAVESLVSPQGPELFTGAEPRTSPTGAALEPEDLFGHDHLYWLDRMVRTNQPFVQRMALIWHDWFATSNNEVENQRLMLDQYELFVRAGRGSFEQLVREVTMDPAMCVFLNTTENRRGAINENYGRELMELFTLGADRGAYTETEVREVARSLSGWTRSYTDGIGYHSFRFDPNRWDTGNKTVHSFISKGDFV